MRSNPSFSEVNEATRHADPNGEGMARLPDLMPPLSALLAKPPVTHEDITKAMAVFDRVSNEWWRSKRPFW